MTRSGDTLNGQCEGTETPFYDVTAKLDAGGVVSASCSCPFNFPGHCKHIVALLLAFAADPQQFTANADIKPQLAQLSREQLLVLFDQLLADLPEMNDWLAAVLAESGEAPTAVAAQPVSIVAALDLPKLEKRAGSTVTQRGRAYFVQRSRQKPLGERSFSVSKSIGDFDYFYSLLIWLYS